VKRRPGIQSETAVPVKAIIFTTEKDEGIEKGLNLGENSGCHESDCFHHGDTEEIGGGLKAWGNNGC
jgi:hypothetical protein